MVSVGVLDILLPFWLESPIVCIFKNQEHEVAQ